MVFIFKEIKGEQEGSICSNAGNAVAINRLLYCKKKKQNRLKNQLAKNNGIFFETKTIELAAG